MLRNKFKEQYIVLSISRLDYTKGILKQLESFTKAVLEHNLHHITYRLIVAPSRESRIEYRRLERKIGRLVHTYNRQLERKATQAYISFEYRNHSLDEVSSWYRLADMLLITPSVDGMNLVVKEYIAAHPKPGIVVLSYTAGAAVQLEQAIQVDPHDTSSIADGIWRAYSISTLERKDRWQHMRKNVHAEDIFAWATSFVAALQDAESRHR
jgi:trehalose-6-phosphate synthase